MKNLLLLSCIFVLYTGCGYNAITSQSSQLCNFKVQHGYVVKWDQLPIPIYIDRNANRQSRQNFIYAVNMWNDSWHYYTKGRGGRIFEVVGEVDINYVSIGEMQDDGVNTLFVDEKYKILRPNAQGETYLRNYFFGSLKDVDVVINNVDYRYFYEDNSFDYRDYTNIPELSTARSIASTFQPSFWRRFVMAFADFLDFLTFWSKAPKRIPNDRDRISPQQTDFISLALHELGHVAGLVHIDNLGEDSIMYYGLPLGYIRRDISNTELSSLECIYKE